MGKKRASSKSQVRETACDSENIGKRATASTYL